MRALIVATVLLLGACVTQLQVVGPYANRLSRDDVHQIKLVVSTRRDIDHGIRKLEAIRPDRVHVESGHIDSLGTWKGSAFFVVKRNGRWVIDENAGIEATNERTIVTD